MDPHHRSSSSANSPSHPSYHPHRSILPIDRTLSPLDKLASQTRQLTVDHHLHPLPSSNILPHHLPDHHPPPSSAIPLPLSLQGSLASDPLRSIPSPPDHPPSSSTHPLHLSIQSQSSIYSDDNPSFDPSIHSFLRHSLSPSPHLPPSLSGPPHRRPSTGRVPSSQATAQVPNSRILSVYGDQEIILGPDHPPPLSDDAHHHHRHHPRSSSSSSTINHNPLNLNPSHGRQTWLSSISTESESSEPDHPTAHYFSGHSISSEDPFQYWQYEASRQSRDVLGLGNLPLKSQPSGLPIPPTHPSQPSGLQANSSSSSSTSSSGLPDPALQSITSTVLVDPNERTEMNSNNQSRPRTTTNFSRPLRPPTLKEATPPSTVPPTPPRSRDISPRDQASAAGSYSDSDPDQYSIAHAIADARDILTGVNRLKQTTPSPQRSQGSRSASLRQHVTGSPSRSRSSVDTASSNGSRRSWKNWFQRNSKSIHDQAYQPPDSDLSYNEPSNRTLDSNHLDSVYGPSNLPSITFNQSELDRTNFAGESDLKHSIDHHHHPSTPDDHLPHPKLAGNRQSLEPRMDVCQTGLTSFHQAPQTLVPSLHVQPDSRSRLSHRLSIYSLPSCDEPTEEELISKPRYESRSPLALETPAPSLQSSPITNSFFPPGSPKSPSVSQPSPTLSQVAPPANQKGQLYNAIAKTKASLAKVKVTGAATGVRTAQDYLQAGIEAHERGDLERSAGLFERAAREDGGCGAGMLMWGLSLRHGWGCQVNEPRAFKWLQKAAESVIEDLDSSVKVTSNHSKSNTRVLSAQQRNDQDAVAKSELVLAIYELGQCFMRGWGCKKDKHLAINYFELAARLGDPDAQQELGFCYTNGKGTKKDLKLAAKYYRMAAAQGVEMMGSQWIWKDKYN